MSESRPLKRRRASSITRLPPEVREACDELIRNGRTLDEILAALRELGAAVSRSAIGRYAKGAKETMEKYNQAREVAKAWVGRLENDPQSDVARLLPEMLRAVAFQSLTSLGQSEDNAAPEDIMLLAKALKDLSSATKTSVDVEIKLREIRERAKAAASAVAQTAKKAGMSADTIASIKRDILGITSATAK